jgi:hypothetical protein
MKLGRDRMRMVARFKNVWVRHPYLTYLVAATVAGVLVVGTSKLSGRGFVSSAGAGYAVIYAVTCLGAIFVGELARPVRDRNYLDRVIFAFLVLGVSLVAIVLSGLVTAIIAPDPAIIYFHLQRSYIESHWQTDETSGFSYFPLDRNNFFVWDKNGRFRTGPYNDSSLISPKCSTAKYSVRLLENHTYIVFRYIDDPDETTAPCLITPPQGQAY